MKDYRKHCMYLEKIRSPHKRKKRSLQYDYHPDSYQSQICSFFLGVGEYTSNDAVAGDMGWIPIFQNHDNV